jgi:hypothetical protein
MIGVCFRYIIDGDEPTLSKPPLWKWVLRIIMLLLQLAPVLRFLTFKISQCHILFIVSFRKVLIVLYVVIISYWVFLNIKFGC